MKFNIFISIFITILFANCSNDDGPSLSSENKILSFSITIHGDTYMGEIDHISKEIMLHTAGLELTTSTVPDISISEYAFIEPGLQVPQNFNNEVNYTVTAENGETATYKINIVNSPYSDEKKILRFDFNIDNEIFQGNIDYNQLFITIETYKDISNIIPIIEISDNATINPDISTPQDFNEYVQYTITAQDGTSNTYTIQATRPILNAYVRKAYIQAISTATITNYDLSKGDLELYLENDSNSYRLEYFDLNVRGNAETPTTDFSFEYNENIATATDYKLRLKKGSQIIGEADYTLDVLAENAPEITGTNKTEFVYGETLIIYGTNLLPELRYYYNFNTYVFYESSRYLSINADATELQLELNYASSHFGNSRPIRIYMYYNDRYADSVVVIFK